MLKPNRKRLNSLKKLLEIVQIELHFEMLKSDNEQACFFLENSVRDISLVMDSL